MDGKRDYCLPRRFVHASWLPVLLLFLPLTLSLLVIQMLLPGAPALAKARSLFGPPALIPAKLAGLAQTSTPTLPLSVTQPQTPYPAYTLTPTSTLTPQASDTPGAPGLTNTTRPLDTPTSTSTSCPIQFSDVPPGSTYYDYVRCLACRGVMSGYPDGTFRPNSPVTRGQAVKIDTLADRITFPIPADRQTFEDVPPGSTFWLYIERASEYAIVMGYRCGQTPNEPCVPPRNRSYFRPNAATTRGQAAVVADRTAGFSDSPSGQLFEDVPVGTTFYVDTWRLGMRSIVSGYTCGAVGEPCVPPDNRPYFRPNVDTTRGQYVKIVVRTFYPFCATP